MPLLFAVTLFVSASLLFMVQPMVGKMVLPLLGGSPAVWNGCMVFFQALLLLGYLYAHWLSTRHEPKAQWKIHTAVLMLPVAAMTLCVLLGAKHTPIAVAESLAPADDNSSPILSVLALLAVAIGVPFLVASTSAPLLQKWFANTGHPSARDPYFLYAASNAGSLISLLGYPIFVEPNLTLGQQAWLFAAVFAVLIGLIFVCGRAAANPIGVPPKSVKPPPGTPGPSDTDPPPGWGRKLKWIALAFVPSSLMLGVTTTMTTDIASIPLLWVIPLALYLVTFIIAFARLPDWFRLVIGNLAPVMILLLVFLLISGVSPGTGIILLLHNATFFFAALMCHYELARDRPSTKYLTEFFLLMSVGGVLGGLFNSIIAPLVFPLVYEYPIALVVACLLVPRLAEPDPKDESNIGRAAVLATDDPTDIAVSGILGLIFSPARRFLRTLDRDRKIRLVLDIVIPVLVGLLFWQLLKFPQQEWFANTARWVATNLTLPEDTVRVVIVFAVPVMICFFFVDRPLRFALSVAAILGYSTYLDTGRGTVYTERSFFGVLKVEQNAQYMRLVHGTTLHGTQISRYYLVRMDAPVPFGSFSPWDVLALEGTMASWDPKQEPLTYYHRSGPVGAAFRELRSRKGGADAKADVAMVGLGTGSASCYALDGQRLTFYEIDPAVKRLVADPTIYEAMEQAVGGRTDARAALAQAKPLVANQKYFTYVGDARRRGGLLDFRMGDARLKLKEDADRKFALLLVDAFSSDSIPVHLLTRESVELYKDRLTDDGILMLHISNKFVRLEPVVAAIAKETGLVARVWNDDGEKRPGKTASSWVALAKDAQTLGTLALPLDEQREKYGTAFRELEAHEDVPAWTDDYSDVLRVMMIPELQKFRKFLGLPTPVER